VGYEFVTLTVLAYAIECAIAIGTLWACTVIVQAVKWVTQR